MGVLRRAGGSVRIGDGAPEVDGEAIAGVAPDDVIGLGGELVHLCPRGREEGDGHVGVARGCGDEDAVRRVVGDHDVDRPERDRRLATHRIPLDVEAVRLELDQLDAREEGGVEEGGGELADATAHRLLEAAVLDDAAGDEPLILGPLADVVVERERLARQDERAVHQLGHAPDVRHP